MALDTHFLSIRFLSILAFLPRCLGGHSTTFPGISRILLHSVTIIQTFLQPMPRIPSWHRADSVLSRTVFDIPFSDGRAKCMPLRQLRADSLGFDSDWGIFNTLQALLKAFNIPFRSSVRHDARVVERLFLNTTAKQINSSPIM